MADSNAQVLRQLDYNWLECQDAQGIFYWNQVTNQTSDTVPQELLGAAPAAASAPSPAPMAAPRPVGGNWLECEDEQGIYYFNQVTQQASETVPPELLAAAPAPQPVAAPMAAAYQYEAKTKAVAGAQYLGQVQGGISQVSTAKPTASYSYTTGQAQQTYASQPVYYQQQQQMVLPGQQTRPTISSYTPMPQVVQAQPQVQQPQPSAAVQKLAFGDWAVYEDQIGMFFAHTPTGQQFEQPPQQFVQAYQRYKAEQEQLQMQQKQIELQKQQMYQQMTQQQAYQPQQQVYQYR